MRRRWMSVLETMAVPTVFQNLLRPNKRNGIQYCFLRWFRHGAAR